MNASRMLRQARRRAGLTQRELSIRARMKQPLIARIESGAVDPRQETIERLLEACGFDVELVPRLGIGIDRSVMTELIKLSPVQRLEQAAAEAEVLAVFESKSR
ncbi:MAG: helix-turn-helix domain-containing protein [Actinomycetota bacterium]